MTTRPNGYGYEHAMAAMNAAAEADPRVNPFGMYVADDFPFGSGGFQWYRTEAELFIALARDLQFLADEDGDPDIESSIDAILAEYQGESRYSSDCMGRLRDALAGVQKLHWLGRFDELRAGGSDFANHVRQAFRGDDVDAGAGDGATLDFPLEDAEVDRFVAWAREWGV